MMYCGKKPIISLYFAAVTGWIPLFIGSNCILYSLVFLILVTNLKCRISHQASQVSHKTFCMEYPLKTPSTVYLATKQFLPQNVSAFSKKISLKVLQKVFTHHLTYWMFISFAALSYPFVVIFWCIEKIIFLIAIFIIPK